MRTALLVIDAQNVYRRKPSELKCEDAAATIRKINKWSSRAAEGISRRIT